MTTNEATRVKPELSNSIQDNQITPAVEARYLLRYIIASYGICHENVLLLVLAALEKDRLGPLFEDSIDTQVIVNTLHDLINKNNEKLNPLGFKIIKTNHPLGRVNVENSSHEVLSKLPNFGLDFPISSRFYVYVNLNSTEETKLATKFTNKEISYIKFCIQQFCESGNTIIEGMVSESHPIVAAVRRIFDGCLPPWKRYITYTSGSTNILHYKDLKNSEAESTIQKLCDNKWFYRTESGRYGMDLRCLIELGNFLFDTYESVYRCQRCSEVVLQGVMCGSNRCLTLDTEEKTVWHLECFEHQFKHIGRNCPQCTTSLKESGVYII